MSQLDRSDAVVGSPPHKMKKVATTLFLEVEQKREFSRQIARRATNALDQSSDKFFPPSAARAALLALGRLLGSCDYCAVVCVPPDGSMLMTATRVADWVAVGSQIVCVLTINGRAWSSCRQTVCLWYAAWDFSAGTHSFVYAHNHHRHISNNPGNFEDRMEACIRLMTALTPAYTHALQNVCCTTLRKHFGSTDQTPCAQSQMSLPSQCSFDDTLGWE